jgi:hypothetical protein
MIAFGPVLLTVITGMCYRLARDLLGMAKEKCHWLLDLHHMSVLSLSFIYPLVVGTLFLIMMFTGLSMARLKVS